jgi:hypothetical protein
MTRNELIEMRNQVIAKLIASGMDEDDARFSAMSAAARPDGFLSEQPESNDPRLVELARAGRAYLNGVEYTPAVPTNSIAMHMTMD